MRSSVVSEITASKSLPSNPFKDKDGSNSNSEARLNHFDDIGYQTYQSVEVDVNKDNLDNISSKSHQVQRMKRQPH